jgi:hypothetical protein
VGKKIRDLTGQKWNKLQVLGRASSERTGEIRWDCVCDCGVKTTVSTDHITRKTNPVKSCGCHRKKRGVEHKDWAGVGDISGNWWSSHITREINQNKRHKVCMDLTIEWAWNLFLKQDRKCALSGIPLVFGNRSDYNTASLDRIDSSKGYEIGNVQWVHKDINFMKRTYSQEYFIQMCKLVAENNK